MGDPDDVPNLEVLRLDGVPAERGDDLAIEAGDLLGVSVVVMTEPPPGTIEVIPEEKGAPPCSLVAWVKASARLDPGVLAAWSAARGLGAWRREAAPAVDWELAWRAAHPRRRPGRRVVLSPPWDASPPGRGELLVLLQPGMAFGLGGHPSTDLCIRALEDAALEGVRLLDFGCGSGVLAFAALRLGAVSALLVDIDAHAVREARENAVLNGLADRVEVREGGADVAGELFDLVIANVFDALLVPVLAEVAARVGPSGRLIVGGVRAAERKAMEARLEGLGFQLDDRRESEGWAVLDAIRVASPDEGTGEDGESPDLTGSGGS